MKRGLKIITEYHKRGLTLRAAWDAAKADPRWDAAHKADVADQQKEWAQAKEDARIHRSVQRKIKAALRTLNRAYREATGK